MKVNIYETVQVMDEQRTKIARVIHQEADRPKKDWATRDELKEFIWSHGESWAAALDEAYAELLKAGAGSPEGDEDDDVLGVGVPAPAPGEDDLLGDVAVTGDPEGLDLISGPEDDGDDVL